MEAAVLVRGDHTGISLVVWWLRLRTSDAGGADKLPCLCSPIILHISPHGAHDSHMAVFPTTLRAS